jgi:hypothetical protein
MQIQQSESPTLLPTLDALDAEFGCENEKCAAGRRRQGRIDAAIIRPSLGRRASRRLTRFLIVLCIGVSATLAWQSYGDAARAMIANSSPQLGWLAPQPAPVVSSTAEVVAPAAVSPDLQRLAVDLAAVRQSVDQLTAQLEADQRQVGVDIAKLQADEQQILNKLSAAPSRPTAAPAQKPAPLTAPPSPSAQAR